MNMVIIGYSYNQAAPIQEVAVAFVWQENSLFSLCNAHFH